MDALPSLRIADLSVFVEVARGRSVSDAARRFALSRAHVEYVVARIEDQLGAALFTGASHELALTAAGKRLLPRVEDVLERVKRLKVCERDEALTLAAPSFILDALLPRLVAAPERALRALSMPTSWIRRHAIDVLVDAAVGTGPEPDLPEPWTSTQVTEIRHGLFATPRMASALGRSPSLAALKASPFVVAVYVSREGLVESGDDRCPIPRHERKIGHEVESIGLACRVAAEADQLVYGPVIAAAPFVASGALVEVPTPGLSVTEPVYVAVDRALVSESEERWLAELVRGTLHAGRPSGIVPAAEPAPPSARSASGA